MRKGLKILVVDWFVAPFFTTTGVVLTMAYLFGLPIRPGLILASSLAAALTTLTASVIFVRYDMQRNPLPEIRSRQGSDGNEYSYCEGCYALTYLGAAVLTHLAECPHAPHTA